MISAGAAIFLVNGILSSSSMCCLLVSRSFCSFSARRFRSNSSCWHSIPMSSGGVRNVYTHPVVRSNSKVDVLKNSLSGGQLNNILPLVVSIGSLFLIKTPTRVLQKFGTYQSKPIVPCLLMNSSMTVICSVQIYCWVHGWIWCASV